MGKPMIDNYLPFLGSFFLTLIAGAALYWTVSVVTSAPPNLPAMATVPDASEITPLKRKHTREARTDEFFRPVIERPLFTPTRRPLRMDEPESAAPEPELVEEVVEEVEVEIAEPPQLQLHGTMASPTGHTALLSRSGEAPEWHLVGIVIEGWTLEAIGDDWVTLKNNDQTFKMELY